MRLPELVNPAIYPLDPNHPSVDFATINRFLLALVDGLMENVVSIDDLRLVAQMLTQLSTDYLSALQASLADRADLRAMVVSVRDNLAAEIARATEAEAALSQRISALEARTLVGTTGQLTKNLTLGVGGSTTTYGITFAKPMPSANYFPFVGLDTASVSLLGNVSPLYPVTDKTAFGCTVTVRNTAALTLASSVTVQVAALQLT